jgi:hypothetical protein
MHTFGAIAESLNRSPVYVSGLQKRFDLPAMQGAAYSDAYATFLRTIVFLRTLNISEETLRDIWHIEKKLLQLLHVDSTGSKTWFLDSCGQTTDRERRLLLSNYDIGVAVPSQALQLGLNFTNALPELFAGKEMGEDALRVLNRYVEFYTRIRCDVQTELRHVRHAVNWASRLQ